MLLSSCKHLKRVIKPNSPKAIGLFLTTAAVGLGLVSLLRYNAKAESLAVLDIDASKTESSAALNQDFMSAIDPDGIYRFSMDIVGGSSEYSVFSLEVVARGLDAQATLKVQDKTGGSVEVYEQVLDEEKLRIFWRNLRSLEVAQLTNLSPQTEIFALTLDELDSKYSDVEAAVQLKLAQSQAAAPNAPKNTSSAIYRFTFQDGLYDYPNSFEVYAPNALQDARYRNLKDLAHRFADETFGKSKKG
ncbi:MAG: hypothetical protein AB8B99_24190 [Phormidesmis sp.]